MTDSENQSITYRSVYRLLPDESGESRDHILQAMSPARHRLEADEWGRWRKRCGLDCSSRLTVSHSGIYTDFL